jgi:hypothetical protein
MPLPRALESGSVRLCREQGALGRALESSSVRRGYGSTEPPFSPQRTDQIIIISGGPLGLLHSVQQGIGGAAQLLFIRSHRRWLARTTNAKHVWGDQKFRPREVFPALNSHNHCLVFSSSISMKHALFLCGSLEKIQNM